MNEKQEFIIKNGVLTGYVGSGGGITIPEGVTSIGDFAFCRCASLTEMSIPESVVEIGGYAFFGCTGLKSVSIPAHVAEIGEHAFDGCTNLVIHAPAGSCADLYAKARNIRPSTDAVNQIALTLSIIFQTDGDFIFEAPDKVIDPNAERYRGADIKLSADHDSEDYTYRFDLRASGRDTPCHWAARDLLENLICGLRTNRYYIVKTVYDFLAEPLENALRNETDNPVLYGDNIGGNYEGTALHLRIDH